MTNSSLITVFSGTIANQAIQLTNARGLHTFLEIGKEYANWIKDRITDYGFIENEDYIIVTERTNGRPRKEYHITLDMGKELAMVERNEKGRQIRRYFIECEKRAKAEALQNPQQNLPLATIEEPTYTHKLKQSELEDLAWLWFSAQRMEDFIRTIQPALDGLSSAYYPQAYTMCVEYGNHIKHTSKLIYRLTQDIEFKGKPFQALYQQLGKKHYGKF